MAVTILKRPYGYILGTEIAISSVSSSAGTALFTSATHSLTVGDFIYIKSTVENYNGFWRVSTVPSSTTFTIEEYSGGTDVAYINTATGTLTTTTAHTWNAVHLPIVYKLSNTLWPVNSVDTVRTIDVLVDSNGFWGVSLSGDIKATGSAAVLDYVRIIYPGSTGVDAFDEIHQIISYIDDTNFVIDKVFESGVSFTEPLTAQFYYNNYTVNVEVWGGLDNGHSYYAVEPYALIATLKLIPDSNGEVKFSISELLKQNIAIKNNLLLGTLPNNLDAFTMFFIKYGESYDDSDGTEVTTYTSSYTSDLSTFEGYAVNAKLPFKNVYSGAMSEYCSANSSQKFLTTFSTPKFFSSQFQDISIIVPDVNGTEVTIYASLISAGYPFSISEETDYPYRGPGVYRLSLSDLIPCSFELEGEDRPVTSAILSVIVTLSGGAEQTISQNLTVEVDCGCSLESINIAWLNYLGGFDYWNFTAYKDHIIDITDSGETEQNTFPEWPNSYGEFADTIRKQTFRNSRKQILVRSQNLTLAQLEGLQYIKTSPLVQIVNSIYDRRTVIVDTDSFTVYKEGQVQQGQQYTISFTITYTDDVPSQKV
jgi:hypothetical protein